MDSFFSEEATDSSEWLLPTLEASAASQPAETAPGDKDSDLASMFEAEQTPCQVIVLSIVTFTSDLRSLKNPSTKVTILWR